ncbi:hypothetical protein GCM10009596_29370 [Arthrobacter rhombi]|uniref:hypothetical protein n=1 Tax=Arthrobacter rhombi TaxID=71253 RepID=UPI0031DFCDDF
MNDEVFAVVKDDFVVSLVSLPDGQPWTFRDSGGWDLITPKNSPYVLDDALLMRVPEDAIEELIDLWDESDGISTGTGYDWSVRELEEYLN